MRENADQNNSKYKHFFHSVYELRLIVLHGHVNFRDNRHCGSGDILQN